MSKFDPATGSLNWHGLNQSWDEKLPEEFSKCLANEKVRHVAIGTNSIGLKAAEEFAGLLAKCKHLQSIHLDSIFMGRDVYDARDSLKLIFDSIFASKCEIKEIKLDHNALGSQCSEEVIKFISDPKMLRTFEKVSLNDCGFAILSAGKFAEGMQKGFDDLKKSNGQCKINVYEMAFNRMEDKGAEPICKVLAENISTIKKLKFCMCMLDDSGTAAVVDILRTNPVEDFDITDDFVGDLTSQKLKELIEKSSTLKSVNISNCLAKDVYAERFLQGLIASKAPIEKVLCFGNEFKSQHLPLLKKLISTKSQTLRELNLQDNLLTQSDLVELHRCIISNFDDNSFKLVSDPVDLSNLDTCNVEWLEKFLENGNEKLLDSKENFYGEAIDSLLKGVTNPIDVAQIIDQIAFYAENKSISLQTFQSLFTASLAKSFAMKFEPELLTFTDILLSMCNLLKVEEKFDQKSSAVFLLDMILNLMLVSQEIFPKRFKELTNDLLEHSNRKNFEQINNLSGIMKSLSKLSV